MAYIRVPFAATGDRATVPVAEQPDGSVSFTKGWPVDYQLDPATQPTAKNLDRQQTNETLYQITSALQQYQQFGTPDFITSSDNGGTAFSYSIGARVRYNPGSGTRVYESLTDSNTTLPTDALNWAEVPAPGASGMPAGAMVAFGGTTAPTGWLMCYGQAVSRTTYSNLFSAIGTNYGVGDGSTTFNLPDLRGRVAVGKDDMGGSAANRITNAVAGFVGTQMGAAGGNQAMQSHTHTATVTDPGHTHNSAANYGAASNNPSGWASTWQGGASGNYNVISSTTGISVSNSSTGAGSSQNVQPSLVTAWIIKS